MDASNFTARKIYARSGARMTAELPLASSKAGRIREMNDPVPIVAAAVIRFVAFPFLQPAWIFVN
jgi:hypothetical protein